MMKIFMQRLLGIAVILVGINAGASIAQAQGFGLSYNSPGFSLGLGQGAYYGGGIYPVAPVIVPRPVVVAPPIIYGGRPYYGGYGPGYGYRGPYHGGYGYPHRRY